MDFDLTQRIMFYHLAISLFGWALAILVGGSLGYVLTLILCSGMQRFPGLDKFLVIFPWRTIVFLGCLVLSRSRWIMWRFGVGLPSDSINITVILLIIFIPWVVRSNLGSADSQDRIGKMLSSGRTLAILSLALAALLHIGMGNYLDWAYGMNDFQAVMQGYAVIGIMMLALDVLLGLGQLMIASRRKLGKMLAYR